MSHCVSISESGDDGFWSNMSTSQMFNIWISPKHGDLNPFCEIRKTIETNKLIDNCGDVGGGKVDFCKEEIGFSYLEWLNWTKWMLSGKSE